MIPGLNNRSLTSKHVIMPGKSDVNAPKVVKCEWFEINTENLDAQIVTSDDLGRFKACERHESKRGKGNLSKSAASGHAIVLKS